MTWNKTGCSSWSGRTRRESSANFCLTQTRSMTALSSCRWATISSTKSLSRTMRSLWAQSGLKSTSEWALICESKKTKVKKLVKKIRLAKNRDEAWTAKHAAKTLHSFGILATHLARDKAFVNSMSTHVWDLWSLLHQERERLVRLRPYSTSRCRLSTSW